MVTTRRIYDPAAPGEKYKVFVDRLWPRGIPKEKAGWDEWLKEVAPSAELRQWFSHDPQKWQEFRECYRKELAGKKAEVARLRQLEHEHGTLTLLYAAKDADHNNAVALREYLSAKG